MTADAGIDRLVEELAGSRTRGAARRELARMGDAAAPRLLLVLDEPGAPPNQRWAAISLLGTCRYKPAVAALINVLRTDASLRGEARRALCAITGEDLGDAPEEWQAASVACPSPAVQAAPPCAAEPTGATDERPELTRIREALRGLAASVEWREPDTARIEIAAHGAARRRISIAFGRTNRKGEPIASVHSDCGPLNVTIEGIMFRHNVTFRYGNYATERGADGATRVVLRCDLVPEDVTPAFLREVLMAMITELEQLDTELHAGDRAQPWRAVPPSERRPR